MNIHPLEVLSRYRDTQLREGQSYSFVLFETKHLQILLFRHSFPNWLCLQNKLKTITACLVLKG